MVDGGREQNGDFGRQHFGGAGRHEFGHYEVLEELGHGAVGDVYVARPKRGEHAGTLVCLKIMGRAIQAAKDSRRQAAIDSLRREARVVAQLRHPNIARLLDSGAYNDVWFVAFELVQGANLGEILELQPSGVGLPPEHVRRIGIEVAAALQCAHEHDVLHRDIKPHNILISTDGQVKVVDFGVAKANATAAADFTVGVGTPRYWAPEQIREESVGPQTDIFALGLVLYELLTTAHPFHHEHPDEHRKNVLRGALPPALQQAGVPDDLVAIVRCCLERDRTKRFQSAQALQFALRSGGKASGFEYDMGEIATAARDANALQRLLLNDGAGAGGPGGADVPGGGGDPDPAADDPTVHAHLERQETRHQTPQGLAEMAGDALPGALTQHVKDAVAADLSLLAQNAYEQRRTQHGRRRQTTTMEGWQHPGISGVRLSEPPTKLEVQPHPHPIAPRESRSTMMEAPGPAPGPEQVRPDPEIDTPGLRRHKAVRGLSQHGTEPGGSGEAAKVVPAKRAARWALLALALIAALCAVWVLKPGARERSEGQGILAPPVAPAAVAEAARDARPQAQPAPAAPPVPLQPTPAASVERTQPTSEIRRPSGPPQSAPPASAKSQRAVRRTNASGAHGELVQVTIGVIPFGEVTVDGKSMGPAPVVVKLSPGSHRVIARSRELRRARTIEVTAESNRVVLDLRNAESSP